MSIQDAPEAVGLTPASPHPTLAKPLELDAHETYLRNKLFGSLNGVRAICCLMVIVVHLEWSLPGPRILEMGWLGVDQFFVISGFLIVTLLIRERERRGSISLSKFYARRSLRIFPIYYLLILGFLALSVAVYPWKPLSLNHYAWIFPVLLTYTQDVIRLPPNLFFHCWSLAMEEQFYLFWPTVEKFAPRPVRWAVLGLLLVLSQALNFGVFSGLIVRIYGDPTAVLMPIFVITFTPILLGVMLAYLLHERASFQVLHKIVGYRWSPFLFLALLIGHCEIVTESNRAWLRLGVHLIMALMLGSLVVREDHYARPILTFPPLARIGVISYGVYLYHVFVINGLEFLLRAAHLSDIGKPAMFVIATLGTIVVAEVSYRFLEQPLLRIKERYHT